MSHLLDRLRQTATSQAHLFYWVANWNLSRAQASLLLGGHVADMVDCTHGSLPNVRPHLGPALHVIAGYITGSPDIAWTAQDFSSLPKNVTALRIDQSNQNLEESTIGFIAKDDEPGASTNATAVEVAKERLARGESYTIYTDQANLTALEDTVASAGLPHGQIVAYQWASPSSNPSTPLPGSSATLQQVNADLSVVRTTWLPGQASPAPTSQHSADYQKGYNAGLAALAYHTREFISQYVAKNTK
jgi:hypothetical protein